MAPSRKCIRKLNQSYLCINIKGITKRGTNGKYVRNLNREGEE